MLYLAKFAGGAMTPVLVGSATTELATARVLQETGEVPVTLHEIPDEMLFCEVRFASDTDDEPDAPANPAEHTDAGVALEPFDDFAAWLESIDDEPLPAALAPTEPPSDGATT